jgi:hypothetical protein
METRRMTSGCLCWKIFKTPSFARGDTVDIGDDELSRCCARATIRGIVCRGARVYRARQFRFHLAIRFQRKLSNNLSTKFQCRYLADVIKFYCNEFFSVIPKMKMLGVLCVLSGWILRNNEISIFAFCLQRYERIPRAGPRGSLPIKIICELKKKKKKISQNQIGC